MGDPRASITQSRAARGRPMAVDHPGLLEHGTDFDSVSADVGRQTTRNQSWTCCAEKKRLKTHTKKITSQKTSIANSLTCLRTSLGIPSRRLSMERMMLPCPQMSTVLPALTRGTMRSLQNAHDLACASFRDSVLGLPHHDAGISSGVHGKTKGRCHGRSLTSRHGRRRDIRCRNCCFEAINEGASALRFAHKTVLSWCLCYFLVASYSEFTTVQRVPLSAHGWKQAPCRLVAGKRRQASPSLPSHPSILSKVFC